MSDIFDKLLAETEIPRMVKVEYRVPVGTIKREDIQKVVEREVEKRGLLSSIQEGQSIALAVGSREISNIDQIVKSVIGVLKSRGALPFIIPAMGSHGGAKAEGQREILAGYGVTEETMGVPIRASMETVKISRTPGGLDVHMDKNACEADAIIPIGRIKPHTDFRGKIESGLMKMLAIGCGKQYGANICHTMGFPNMSQNVTEIAHEMIAHKNVLFGVGIIEDAFHGTYKITAVPGACIEEEEPALLEEAKALIPGIPFEKIDVLILDEIGKDISGAGMDPNVTGRSIMLGTWKPFVERIAVLNLSEKSHHNGSGIGSADVTTQRFFKKMDFETSYPNGITSHDPVSMKIPPVMPNDRNAVRMALQTCVHDDKSLGYRMVWLHNTLHMDCFYISEALLDEAVKNEDITIVGEPECVVFDADGNVPWIKK